MAAQPKEKKMIEGKEYPVMHLSISSHSHPFFKGTTQAVDAEGRISSFQNRYKKKQQEAEAQASAKSEPKKEKKKTTPRKTKA
jgi:large subunit ribosomal protein L31